MKNRSLFLLIFVSLLLAACAPQVTVTSEVTVTLPPPTDPPAPTPTPVAVDGVATIDGVLYVFDEAVQEWVVLPELDGEFERVVVMEDGRIVALDVGDTELYELSTAGEWVMAVPVEWREFAAGLPEGVRLDAEAGRVYDALNNVLYVLDAETNEWREPIRLEYSPLFPADPNSLFKTEATVKVGEVELTIPMTLGVMEDVTKRSKNRIRQIGMTEQGAEGAAWLIAHAFWGRYRDLMGNPDVTFEQYMQLVNEGKGQVEVLTLEENGVTKRTTLQDLRQGVSIVCTARENLPVKHGTRLEFFLGTDEVGRTLFVTNRCNVFGDERWYPSDWGKHINSIFVSDNLNDFATMMGAIPNSCMQTGNVYASCGLVSAPDDYIDVWYGKLREGFLTWMAGETDEELFWLK